MKSQTRFKIGDIIIFIAVLCLAAGIWAVFLPESSDKLMCQISKNDEMLYNIPLDENSSEIINIGEGNDTVIIEINGKSASVVQSSCKDQLCVHAGTLTKAGQMAVCLPNQVIVRIVGQQNEVDAIVG